jgi:iron complex outermembrane receptor protein
MDRWLDLTAALSCGATMAFAPNAFADVTEDAGKANTLDEIVVTAQKRISTVQTTPISISVVSGDDLLARGVASLAALAQGTPGVSLKGQVKRRSKCAE